MWAGAPESSPLVEALLAAETRDQTLVDVFAGLGVIKELISWVTGALSPVWSLNAAVTAAPIVQCTVILVFIKNTTVSFYCAFMRHHPVFCPFDWCLSLNCFFFFFFMLNCPTFVIISDSVLIFSIFKKCSELIPYVALHFSCCEHY